MELRDVTATFDTSEGLLYVYIHDLYDNVSRNTYDGSTWSGWETVVASGVQSTDRMGLRAPQYTTGVEIVSFHKLIPTWSPIGEEYGWRVIAPVKTWIGSRFGIASGLRALSRLANGLGAAVRIAAGTKL